MPKHDTPSMFRLRGPWLTLISIVFGIIAAYFMTIQSLKVELAAKAEAAMVGALDKKLAGIEVLLKEGVVGKEQFYQFSTDIEARLIRIEDYLVAYSGENLGKE
jgi:hypothetical protein